MTPILFGIFVGGNPRGETRMAEKTLFNFHTINMFNVLLNIFIVLSVNEF